VLYYGQSLWDGTEADREKILRRTGVLYQKGAMWSSMTLAENIALPLGEYTDLSAKDIRELASLKLALVGLAGFEDYYPSEISGGMQKRAGLARAMALDPEILFFDEPSAGLDPISSRLLDDLILELRDSLGATIVVVTHELASIFVIANNSVYLDADTRTMIAQGDPKLLVKECPELKVRNFLTRGEAEEGGS
jgi:phospholipid/cholesterol/gamma-HCH transport system ATP-binding protein